MGGWGTLKGGLNVLTPSDWLRPHVHLRGNQRGFVGLRTLEAESETLTVKCRGSKPGKKRDVFLSLVESFLQPNTANMYFKMRLS